MIFVYHRDERGWTYGEIVSEDYARACADSDDESALLKPEEAKRETIGWFPTSILSRQDDVSASFS